MFRQNFWAYAAQVGSAMQQVYEAVNRYLDPLEGMIQAAAQHVDEASREAQVVSLAWHQAQEELVAAQSAHAIPARIAQLEKKVQETAAAAEMTQHTADEAVKLLAALRTTYQARQAQTPPVHINTEALSPVAEDDDEAVDAIAARLWERISQSIKALTGQRIAAEIVHTAQQTVTSVVQQANGILDSLSDCLTPAPPPALLAQLTQEAEDIAQAVEIKLKEVEKAIALSEEATTTLHDTEANLVAAQVSQAISQDIVALQESVAQQRHAARKATYEAEAAIEEMMRLKSDLQDRRKKLASHSHAPITPITEPNVWDYTYEQLNFLEPNFLNQLKEMMDPEMYQVMHDTAKDMHQRYTMSPATGKVKPIFYYQNLINWFRDAKAFAQACSKVHQQVPTVMGQSQLVRQAWTYTVSPFRGDLDTAYEEYARFYESNEHLGVYRAMAHHPTWEGAYTFLQRVANQWMPLNKIIQAVYDNPLVRGFEVKKLWEDEQEQQNTQNIWGFVAKAQRFIDKARFLMTKDQVSTLEKCVTSLKSTLLTLTRGEISPITEDEINRTVQKLIFALQVCDAFLNSSQSFLQGLIMFCRVYPKAQYVARHILEVYAAIKKGLQQHLLATAHQINEIFKEWTLMWDKHEVEFFLKAHSLSGLRLFPPLTQAKAEHDIQPPSESSKLLSPPQPSQIQERKPYSSLQDMIEWFYHFVEEKGFHFEPSNQFPYPTFLLKQRQQQLVDYETAYRAIPPSEQHLYFEKKLNFLRRRVEDAKSDIDKHKEALLHKAQAERKAFYEKKQTEIDTLIDTRIEELQAESAHWLRWAVKLLKIWDIKQKKLRLLEAIKQDIHAYLQRLIVKDCPEDRFFKREYVEKKLRERKLNPTLLFSGRTGRMFEHLRYHLSTRDDEMDILQDEINQLALKAYDVFFDKTRKTLTKRVDALKKLKDALQKPGYRLQAALDAMRAEDLHSAQCLLRYERPILDKIRRIEAHLSVAVIGRKTVEPPKAPKPELTAAAVREMNDWLQQRTEDLQALKRQQGLFSVRTGWRIKKMEARIANLKTLLEVIQSPYSRWYEDKSPTFSRILLPTVGAAIVATDSELLRKIQYLVKHGLPPVVDQNLLAAI